MLVDFTFYKDTFYGKIVDEATFSKLLIQAEATLNYYTFGRLNELTESPSEAKFAACELIDLYHDYDAKKANMESTVGRIASETVGSHSVAFKYADEIFKVSDPEAVMKKSEYEIVCKYLMPTGLLYRGV